MLTLPTDVHVATARRVNDLAVQLLAESDAFDRIDAVTIDPMVTFYVSMAGSLAEIVAGRIAALLDDQDNAWKLRRAA